ncbi:trypsin-like peptidase domain-containing protein [Sorangium sp. So ce1097]|uniref:trypsin-like peptidase domain-containing protein n=1 Tax=Sorangium sp. So ce1097 TaxID=3133330 RepID=UPI003F5E8DEB
MLRVVHTFGRNAGSVELHDRRVVRFGRAPDNDVVFDPNHDRDASSHHAEARLEASGWVLYDLDSRNGTYAGGQRIKRHPIASGDEITFGAKGPRVRLELIERRAPSPAPAHAAHAAAHPAPPAAYPAATGFPAPAAYPAATGFPAPAAYPAATGFPAPAAGHPAHAAPAAGYPAHAAGYPAHAAPGAAHAGHVPPAPPAGARRVGERTIAMMISSAVAAATGRSKPRGTVEINAMLHKEVHAATAGHRRTTYILALLLVVALASLAALIVYNRSSHVEIAQLREELARLAPEDPRRKEIERRLGTLHPSNANFGRNLHDRSRKGIFMLASGREGFCTAFAVRPSVLATNAHCIAAAKRRGGSIVALENEGRGQVSFAVTSMRTHPQYRDSADQLTPDIGVVSIGGRAAAVLELATREELAAAGAGDDVYLIGFPERLTDAANPVATFLAANIGRITGANGRPAPFAEAWLVQHDARSTSGMSGSPIFNGQGKVIGINAGGYLEGNDETISGQKTEVVKASPYKFGMRIDLLDAILR